MTQSASDEHLNTLDTTTHDSSALELARRHAPLIFFDKYEPFMPIVVGYTVFEETAPSPSFPRTIEVNAPVARVIEYAIWWDWDIGHLYELEHIWVYLDSSGEIVRGEASWHGGFSVLQDNNGHPPIENGRVVAYSEPGKHAFASSIDQLLERRTSNEISCWGAAGYMGVLVTPLFNGIIHSRRPLNNRLVHTYLERQRFVPSYEFTKAFRLQDILMVPWSVLKEWIPSRIDWWLSQLNASIPPNERRGLRIAHRGASAYAQENSAQSLHKAAALGADMVEIDVRMTADDVPVISHDASLRRLYAVYKNISDLTLAELGDYTQQVPVMTFEETVAVCRDLRLGLYLDIKELSWAAAESLFATLDRFGYWNFAIFGSFQPDYLAEIKAHRPDAVTSILFNSVHVDPVALARSINADYVHPCWESRAPQPHQLLTPAWIRQVRNAGLGIVCWHEERPEEIAALWNLGVDAICSDTPERLVTPVLTP
jgi:glycerophosphoryl diester phosphodiesterase